jgi:hypothetical protein
MRNVQVRLLSRLRVGSLLTYRFTSSNIFCVLFVGYYCVQALLLCLSCVFVVYCLYLFLQYSMVTERILPLEQENNALKADLKASQNKLTALTNELASVRIIKYTFRFCAWPRRPFLTFFLRRWDFQIAFSACFHSFLLVVCLVARQISRRIATTL